MEKYKSKQSKLATKQTTSVTTLPTSILNQPAISAVVPGLAGITAEMAEPVLPLLANLPLPLPGMESYFPLSAPLPLELDNSSESLTETLNKILGKASLVKNNDRLTREQLEIIWKWEDANGCGVGACLNIFPSGEITGGCYSLGRRNRTGGRSGKILSNQFTKQAKKTIRRAAECSPDTFKLFVTLTFDPKLSLLNESGQVDQPWAKKEFTRFLNTIKKKYDRMKEKTGKDHWELEYIWVAEIQEKNTMNIHFHILLNRSFIPVDYLVTVWGQARNSVNVKRLKNPAHAVSYMLKYMKKGNCPIEGKRYGMTKKLMERAQPERIRFDGREKRNAFRSLLDDSFTDISQMGGHKMDWGFAIPPQTRQRTKSSGSSNNTRKLQNDFLKRIKEEMEGIGATSEILNDLDEIAMERAAIVDCESGIYQGKSNQISFGGEE